MYMIILQTALSCLSHPPSDLTSISTLYMPMDVESYHQKVTYPVINS